MKESIFQFSSANINHVYKQRALKSDLVYGLYFLCIPSLIHELMSASDDKVSLFVFEHSHQLII
jgi:hypothetical protein